MKSRWRRIALIAVLAGLAPGTWLRTPKPPPNLEQTLGVAALATNGQRLGLFRIAGAWQLSSPNSLFGSYSALVAPAPGRLLAVSDRGDYLDFGVPGGDSASVRIGRVPDAAGSTKHYRDFEAATRDPATGRIFLALEGRSLLAQHGPDLKLQAVRRVPEMRRWGENTGPEAMVRLSDGRFVILCECTGGWQAAGEHPALLLAKDSARQTAAMAFTFAGTEGYRPTDMAELPDGRVLVLLRRLTWPMPPRFKAQLLLADPAQITAGGTWRGVVLAELAEPLPVDNFEALAVTPGGDGQAIVWLLSDDNQALTQRTVLLKLELLLKGLPPKQKAPGTPDAHR